MKWLLDINVVSETAKRRPNMGVIGWLAGQRPDELAVSMITVAELRMGAFARIDAERRRELMQWIETTVGTWLWLASSQRRDIDGLALARPPACSQKDDPAGVSPPHCGNGTHSPPDDCHS